MISFVKFFGKKNISLIFALIFLAAFNLTAYGAGELDSTFTASAYGNLSGNVNVVKVQPDGKILIGGFFTEVNDFAASGIARLNADGSVDTSFKSVDFFGGFGIGGQVFAIALQTDGKILVGGSFFGVDGVSNPGVRRLNSDGSLDTSFNILTLQNGTTVYDIEVQSDNKILVGGDFSGVIFRLNADGTGDNTFSFGAFFNVVKDIEIQADGKILMGGTSLRRLNTNGSIDNTFPNVTQDSGTIEAVKIRPDGKILIGGGFSGVNSFTQGRISLINSDGSIDLTFNLNNPGANGAISDITLRPDGKILIGGGFSAYNTTTRQKIAQLNTDGSLDTSFQSNSTLNLAFVNDVELLPDGRILVGINSQTGLSSIMRFNADGTFDSTFMVSITRTGRVRKVLQQTDGKVLVGGEFPTANGVKRTSVARFNADGTLDTSFVPYFNNLSTIQTVSSLALQPDGKILVGTNSGSVLKRMNSDGSEDTSFTTSISGSVNDIAVLSSGQILVGGLMGPSGPKHILRLNANGTIDTSFATVQPNAPVHKILVQPDGKIFIGGDFTQVGASLRGRIARLNSDGTLDNTFNPPGGANNQVFDFDLQTDGKVVLGGAFTALNGSSNQIRIGRLNADGTLDTGFVQAVNASVLAVKIEPNGKILIGGSMSFVQGIAHNGIARLNPDGLLDSSFNTFANTTVWDIILQSDGKILIVGEFTKINRLSAVRIARLLNASAPLKSLFDYDGDGRADVSVYRSSTNRWYEFLSSNSTVTEQTFGISGDVLAPADFDGDGKTDIAVFRPSTGDWWYLSSINNAQVQTHWGGAGDIPRPSDFDGDGKADFVVFRAAENNWYRFGSTGAVSIVTFGLAGDKPVVGDFDGDGKSDVAIYRPSTGTWWYRSSINNAQIATQFGIASDIPAPADYDGDGKTDLAVYRPSTGTWYILNSSNGQATILNFGIAEDKPVAADYDGDGKADIAVFRPSTGVWYLMRTSSGFTALQFGVSSDSPTPNAFVP